MRAWAFIIIFAAELGLAAGRLLVDGSGTIGLQLVPNG
jgi:hypothetical protein